MDLTVISTFRCNSKCQMCYIWKNPTDPREEVSLQTLAKLPEGFDNLNVSGGEPTLRRDLVEIVDILYPKARVMEISSNGLLPERLLPIIRKFPDIKVRFSLEGDEITSNRIRGEKNGYVVRAGRAAPVARGRRGRLGLSLVIQDENMDQLVRIYEMTRSMGFELATSTLHNAWQFYKNDNYFYDRMSVARQVEGLITSMLEEWHHQELVQGLSQPRFDRENPRSRPFDSVYRGEGLRLHLTRGRTCGPAMCVPTCLWATLSASRGKRSWRAGNTRFDREGGCLPAELLDGDDCQDRHALENHSASAQTEATDLGA